MNNNENPTNLALGVLKRPMTPDQPNSNRN